MICGKGSACRSRLDLVSFQFSDLDRLLEGFAYLRDEGCDAVCDILLLGVCVAEREEKRR